jgi:transcriptional regulator with GAF, ATPase, and Fis domain
VNCAAIPSELIESELFGHMKGSFTGAVSDRAGKFEQADTGTLFLDEIGDMSLTAQAKVLRVLQDGVVTRIGSAKPVKVDVRVLSATNKNLEEEIAAARFREDLYYRLNVVPVHIPPLRERREDIPLLASHFVRTLSEREGVPPRVLDPSAVDVLTNMDWPGNVRELRNTLERLLILSSGPRITVTDVERLAGRRVADGASLGSLLECKTFKDAAGVLAELAADASRSFPRTAGMEEQFLELTPDLMAGVTPAKLRAAFLKATTPKPVPKVDLYHVAPIRASVTEAVAELVERDLGAHLIGRDR